MNKREDIILTITENEEAFPSSERIEDSHLELFGELVFDERMQRKKLPSKLFHQLHQSIHKRVPLSYDILEKVAEALKEWAIEKGATHYCHWFQPLTELSHEKHSSLYVPTPSGGILSQLSGSDLVRGEADASSFPTPGLRSTYQSRGYTLWDPQSSPFIRDSKEGAVLVIPTLFIGFNGEALDRRIPLIRSIDALEKEALRLLRLLGNKQVKHVFPTVGAEQEYFLIDTLFFRSRPDLVACGRTVFGSSPPKGQELEDNYLGIIPPRVLNFMVEVENELRLLGIPVQARHNEVAPSQFEITLFHEPALLASDHQMILMETLKTVAHRHGMTCLLHEKPFLGMNGSGKHNNWSIATDEGINLLEPGQTPESNIQFLLFLAAVIRAVHRYSKQLRMSIATAGNDHRLGKHEAPPAIISVFLGEELEEIFSKISEKRGKEKARRELEIGLSHLPKVHFHTSDRNRTSPFAFTGNKFEFRSVGSSENIANANTVLNTIVAESLDYFSTSLEKSLKEGLSLFEAARTLLTEEASLFAPILFEGNNYDPAWVEEAKKRGLPHLSNAVEATHLYTAEETIDLFSKYKVLSRQELISRQEVALSTYVKKIKIEAAVALSLAKTEILPAALRMLALVKEAGLSENDLELSTTIDHLLKAIRHLEELLMRELDEQLLETARFMRDQVIVSMDKLRKEVDRLEEMVDDSLWPLPKYREMLFIR